MASTWDPGVEERDLRPLALALAASLALHALLLFLLPALKEAQRRIPAPALTARLAREQLPAPVPAPPKAEPPVRSPAKPQALPSVKAEPQPAVQPAPQSPPVVIAEPAKLPAEPAFVVPAPPPAPAAAPVARLAPAPSAPVAAAGGPDPGTVARFRLELMDLARRYKRYPRIAQDNNWEGRVELRIAIGEDGAISALTVRKGAGRPVLDEEAQAMLRTAKSKATIPPALRGKAFFLDIPVDFFLKDDEK